MITENYIPRTEIARNALDRAKRIVARNELVVEMLKKECHELDEDLYQEEERKSYPSFESSYELEQYQIKTSSKVVGFFRELLH